MVVRRGNDSPTNGSLASFASPLARASLAVLALSSVFACAPTSFSIHADRAARAERAAAASHAQKYAPYEYTLARLYLEKAREQAGQAEYASALELARRAEVSAGKASGLSRARGAGQ